MSLLFQVTKESGPPHMRTFVTRCRVGEFATEGEGKAVKRRYDYEGEGHSPGFCPALSDCERT